MGRKTGPRRNPAERQRDLVIVSDLYLKGATQEAIARRVSQNYPEDQPITRQQVGYDIQKLIKRWQKEQLLNIGKAMSCELARINLLERESWDAWARSQQDAQTVTVRTRPSGQGQGQTAETFHKSEGQTGDPSFLRVVQWCVEQRCSLLGLTVARLDVTTGGEPLVKRVYVEVVPPDEADYDLEPGAGGAGAEDQTSPPPRAV